MTFLSSLMYMLKSRGDKRESCRTPEAKRLSNSPPALPSETYLPVSMYILILGVYYNACTIYDSSCSVSYIDNTHIEMQYFGGGGMHPWALVSG